MKKKGYKYKKKNSSYYKRKYAKKKYAKKRKSVGVKNRGGHARLLRVQNYYQGTGYRPFIRVKGIFSYGDSITPTSGVYPAKVFRGNDPWDPDYALGGQVCQNWPQITTLGTGYYCVGSSISVSFKPLNTGATSGNYMPVTGMVVASAAAAFSISGGSDEYRSGAKFCPGARQIQIRGYGDPDRNYPLRMSRKTKTMLPYANRSELCSLSMSGGPTTVWYWHILPYDDIGNPESPDATQIIRYQVTIIYDIIVFNEPAVGWDKP